MKLNLYCIKPQVTLFFFIHTLDNVKGFKRYAFKDYGGSDIKYLRNIKSIHDCSKACDKVTGCSGFLHHLVKKLCILKHTIRTSGPNYKNQPKSDLYIRNDGPARKCKEI